MLLPSRRRTSFLSLAIILSLKGISLFCSGLSHPDAAPKVLFESNRLLVIEKEPGIAHHNDESTGELGIVNQVRLHYGKDKREDGWDGRLYGVHRLDQVTSGILLFAKDAQMAGTLSGAFRDNLVTKYYVGISNRKPKKKKQGWVKGNMVRGRRKSWFLTRDETEGSNYAITRFFTAGLRGIDNPLLHGGENPSPTTCLLFQPKTGKTHQLRVAAKSVGLPLLGDPLYGDHSIGYRTFLHAAAIHIPLDCGHEPVTIWSSPPFASLLWEGDAQASFDEVVDNLFQKHCDSPEILSVKQNGK